MARRWILGVFAAVVFSLLAIYPQLRIQQIRGDEFQGAFASCDLDEMAYASYLQALIDGRPRKNDPYTGRDDSSDRSLAESLFSIQFVPAYAAAVPARVLGLSAVQMMPVISVASAFLTALALFWLLLSFTGDELFSFAGTLIVLVCGGLIVGIGALNGYIEGGVPYPFFPMLRRPIPSLAFPLLFSFLACIWNGLNADDRRGQLIYSLFAGLCFGGLMFSYFYLWTSAAAVLAALFVLLALVRSDNRKKDLTFLVTIGVWCFAAAVPYALALRGRSEMADKAQLLVLTRMPDLFRAIEILGLAIAAAAIAALLLKAASPSDRRMQFIAALGLSTLIVFNQQVLTGRSLQPFHYEFYVINYVVLVAIVAIASVCWFRYLANLPRLSSAALILISSAAAAWGYVEATQTTEFWDDVNVRRDEAMPVNLRLRELSAGDIDAARLVTTVNLEALQADSQPTVAPQAVLWARHQHTFSGIESWEENKRRYYQLLYYSDLDGRWLKRALTGCGDIEACMALFGWDRFNPRLSAAARPLTIGEIDAEVAEFDRFRRDFSPEDARSPALSYAVTYSGLADKFENLDKWYERGPAEILGSYTLYPLKLRDDTGQ